MILLQKNMPKYSVENATNSRDDALILSAWRELLSVSTSAEKVYQTPEFFEFLIDTNNGNDHFEILVIRSLDTKHIVGVIPIRFRRQSFRFSLGPRSLAEPTLEVITLLGSVPLISAEHAAFEVLLKYLFETYPSCSALSMPSLGRDSVWHTYIQHSPVLENAYCHYVIDEWRECHLIPLAKNFEAYLQRFSSKKRFNLKRQVRLLREFGEVDMQLDRIEQGDQIPALIAARKSMVPTEWLPQLLGQKIYQGLAKQGLFLSYLLRAGDKAYALIVATRSEKKLLIHNIYYHPDVAHLSAGISILYMAIEDLINNLHMESIDLGYSNPANNHHASNQIEIRGHMLLLRKTWKNRLLISAHQAYVTLFNEIKKIIGKQQIRKLLDLIRR
ncbi:GNAT family N-acetyltransferase [Undibacterium sp.]|uniref:GNAT family N-acetyltransferase n=1 Tax=Undibacterium sp. TaxID=1914977 RepID=UPI0025DCC73F|nr:GNAT family N-acetyltransferase [Undibacterium sp.]